MKKIWKTRTEEGVSPVIATILMVAITVVLAAVLYVMVINMGPGPSERPPAGSVQFEVLSSTSVKMTFNTFSPTPVPTALKVFLTPTTGTPIEIPFTTAPTVSLTNLTAGASGLTGGGWVTYYDYQATGSQVNAGDYMTIHGLSPSTTYTLVIFHNPSSSTCSIVGTTSFTTP